jgi:hypothetical protein
MAIWAFSKVKTLGGNLGGYMNIKEVGTKVGKTLKQYVVPFPSSQKS